MVAMRSYTPRERHRWRGMSTLLGSKARRIGATPLRAPALLFPDNVDFHPCAGNPPSTSFPLSYAGKPHGPLQDCHSLVPPRPAPLGQCRPLAGGRRRGGGRARLHREHVEGAACLDGAGSSGVSLRLPRVARGKSRPRRRTAHFPARRCRGGTGKAHPGERGRGRLSESRSRSPREGDGKSGAGTLPRIRDRLPRFSGHGPARARRGSHRIRQSLQGLHSLFEDLVLPRKTQPRPDRSGAADTARDRGGRTAGSERLGPHA